MSAVSGAMEGFGASQKLYYGAYCRARARISDAVGKRSRHILARVLARQEHEPWHTARTDLAPEVADERSAT